MNLQQPPNKIELCFQDGIDDVFPIIPCFQWGSYPTIEDMTIMTKKEQ
jgi:hypothetical protein